MKEKQIVIVLMALFAGYRTSSEIAEFTGIPLKHCSAYLNELRKAGLAQSWPGCNFMTGLRGAPARLWGPVNS